MAFDRTKPADTDYISASAANLRENFRALAEDTRLYGTGAPESSAGQNGWRYVDTATGDEYLKVNGAWTKKTDLAALIATLLGEDVYKQSNIIGTVGQLSGVPTGAIIESGSNANGKYIKFADGTQICALTTSLSNGEYAWTYPAVFAETPQMTCLASVIQGTYLFSTTYLRSSGASSATFYGNVSTNGGSTWTPSAGEIHITAIGRWY